MHETDKTWSVKERRILMPKTCSPLLSLSVMDRDHEVATSTIAMNAKETLHAEEFHGKCQYHYLGLPRHR